MNQDLFPEDVAREFYAGKGGKPYRPSNGTEGEHFMGRFCNRCAKDSEDSPCDILTGMFFFDVDEAEYPPEVIWTDRGQPTCTAFEPRKEQPK